MQHQNEQQSVSVQIELLRQEMKAEIAAAKTEIAAVRTEIEGVKSIVHKGSADTLKWIVALIIANFAATVGTLWSLIRTIR